MKKVLIPLAVLLVCAFIITGCGTGTTTTVPASATGTTKPISTTTAGINFSTSNPLNTQNAGSNTSSVTTSSASTQPSLNKYGGSLKIIEAAAPGSPLGATWETPFGYSTTQIALEPLLKEQIDGTLDPRLATSYEVDTNPDSPSITFHLRKGVKFCDGTDFNAQAVKFTFDKVKNSGYFGGTKYWASIEVVDDYTIKIPFTMNRNSSLSAFAKNQCYVISPTAFEKNGIDWIRWNMVGTGPFTQTDFQRDVSLTAVKNTNYWNTGLPYLDSIQYLYVADELTRIALYKSGGADVMNANGNARVASEFQAEGYTVLTQATGTAALFPDSANPDSPWSNLKVRAAAEFAIDKEGIAKAFGYGYWKAAYQLPPSTSTAYVADLEARKYDVAKAKSLLTEAGYPNGFKTKIIAQNTVNKDIIVAIQAQLNKVGIQCELEFPEPAKFVETKNGTWKNALLYDTTIMNANYNVVFGFTFPSPQAIYKSIQQPEGYADMYNATMTSPTVEPKLQQVLIQAFYDNACVLPIFYNMDMFITRNNLKDPGWGTRGDSIYWNPDQAWIQK